MMHSSLSNAKRNKSRRNGIIKKINQTISAFVVSHRDKYYVTMNMIFDK